MWSAGKTLGVAGGAVAGVVLATAPVSQTGNAGKADAQRPLLGLIFERDSGVGLARLDPRTLELRGTPLDVGEQHGTPVYSPQGGHLAIGVSEPPPPGLEAPDGRVRVGLWVVDTAPLRLVRRVQTGVAVEAVTWPTDDRILAYVQSGELAVIDADTGRALSYRRIPSRVGCCVEPMVAVPRGAAVLNAPPGHRGLRLLLFDTRGGVRRVGLRRLRPGARASGGTLATAGPGRLLASAPRAPLAIVDTASGRKRYVTVPPGPRCPADFECRSERTVVYVGDGNAAVADSVFARRGRTQRLLGRTWLVDTRSGGSRLVARQPYVTYGGGILAAHGNGLTALTGDGRVRFSAIPKRRVWQVIATRGRVYAATEDRRPRLLALDARTGAVLGRRAGYVRLVAPSAR